MCTRTQRRLNTTIFRLTIVVAAVVGIVRPAGADTNQLTGSDTGPVAAGALAEIWETNSREAFRSLGSDCPWDEVLDPAVSARFASASPSTAAPDLRFVIDCRGEVRAALRPSGSELASFATQRVLSQVPVAKVAMAGLDGGDFYAGIESAYRLTSGHNSIVRRVSFLGRNLWFTITPKHITSSWGDGTNSLCLVRASQPRCTHTFAAASATPYRIVHTVAWSVTWRADDGTVGSYGQVTQNLSSSLTVAELESGTQRESNTSPEGA